jgi:glycosyltransferase involved in cell wall biosynthesis
LNPVSTRREATPVPTVSDYRNRPKLSCRAAGGRSNNALRNPKPGLVTIVTVSFNSAKTIEKTIDSIKAQQYPSIEYLVIDGGSTDGTVDILRQRSSDIDIWVSEPDSGISDAFNKGIALASGTFIAFINSDDWIESGHIAVAVARFEATDAEFVYGDLALHSPDGTLAHFFRGDINYNQRISHYMPFLNHPSVVARSRAFERAGLFDPSLRTAMDYDWFLRLHNSGGVGVYDRRLLAHMALGGESDTNFQLNLREVREISIRHGYPRWSAWLRYWYRFTKSTIRRQLHILLPISIYEFLRKKINANYYNIPTR